MNQTELEKLINKYTENYGKIPECIYANYMDSLDIADFKAYVGSSLIRYEGIPAGIKTPFGTIRLKLDPDATHPYGANDE